MNCRQFRQFYSDFADGFLDDSEGLGFQLHMAGCDSCRRFHEALQQGCSTLQRMAPPAASFDFDSRLFERIMQECEQERATPRLRQWYGLAGAALVIAAVGVVGWEARTWVAPRHQRPAQNGAAARAADAFVVRLADDTTIRYPGHLPVLPVSSDSQRSPSRPARSFEITVDWMNP